MKWQNNQLTELNGGAAAADLYKASLFHTCFFTRSVFLIFFVCVFTFF